jgi:dephospho-CoA kinase
MITDQEIRLNGMRTLIQALGEVQAERFIALIQRDNFDYTQWQQDLFNEMSIEELSSRAQNHVEENPPQ